MEKISRWRKLTGRTGGKQGARSLVLGVSFVIPCAGILSSLLLCVVCSGREKITSLLPFVAGLEIVLVGK